MQPYRIASSILFTISGTLAVATASVAQTTSEAPGTATFPSTPAPTVSASPQDGPLVMGGGAASNAAMMQTIQSMLLERRRLSDETRSAMLGTLTPAHRTYVASLVGALAIAAAPDAAAAARQIDATLTPGERQGVLRVDAERISREGDVMRRTFADLAARMSPADREALATETLRARLTAQHETPQQRAAMARQAQQMMASLSGTAAFGAPQTAGQLLLRTLTPHANLFGL